mmetsp:Transcript_43500/g.51211  ORF Transcript_43500/g.51211 Transcript_43500/m.51211 type:complete len:110 (-) Transcript_43500:724-1053(-)
MKSLLNKRIRYIESGLFSEKDSLRDSTVNILRHPEYVIKNSLEFSKPVQMNLSTDFNSTFIDPSTTAERSPNRFKVRFENMSKASEEAKEAVQPKPPQSRLSILDELRK